jgi:alginate O-acetyltransferase complex protein AlgI
MIFTSLPFVIFFACLFLALAVVRGADARRWLLLGASLFFYAFWNVWCVLIMGAVIIWSYLCGLKIEEASDPAVKRRWITVGATLSLTALAVFKYAGFFAANAALITGVQTPDFVKNIILPVGISFYTFHSISYYVDVYRGHVRASRSLRDYALYIAFFPQLVAGPIVRASSFLPQIARPMVITRAGLISGARLVLIGLAQKLVMADQVSPFVDRVFEAPAVYSGATIWLAALAYAIQIFGDFSGYTLMAIGIARMLGFQLPQNFNMPYLAISIRDFWRRWHISLSQFLRDYLYKPLGGNKHGFARTQINVAATMLLGGLWHGASWNFVAWGALHGAAIVVQNVWDKAGLAKGTPSKVGAVFSWAVTLLFVLLTWIPFRSPSWDNTTTMLERMFTFAPGIGWAHTPTLLVFAGVAIWHLLVLARTGAAGNYVPPAKKWAIAEAVGLALLVLLFSPVVTSPFIYFQF